MSQVDAAELLSGMVIYAAVVDSGSFTGAAERLGMSKSTVSKAIARLEDRLGVLLLNRTTRKLALTEAGQGFYQRCTRVIQDAEEAELSVSSHQVDPKGTLRITAPLSFGLLHLSPALPEFMSRYPEIQVEMSLNDRFIDLIDEGFDVAVRIGELADSSLIARRIAPSRVTIVASPGYLAERGHPNDPRALVDHDCLIYTYTRQPKIWSFASPEGPIQVHVDGPLAANNGDMLYAAALAGRGIARLPTFISWRALSEGTLVELFPDFRFTGSAYAVYPHNRHVSAKVRVFVDFLVERFGPEPYWDAL
ncbi:MAG: LysR family transcriptional regulator [Bradymonadia bacterium]